MGEVLPRVSAPQMKTVAQAVRSAVLNRYSVDSCIESTAILIDVLARLGVPATPAPVLVAAFNRAAQQVLTTTPDLPADQWPDDAWSVGQGPGQPFRPGGWPGHLVAVVPTAAATRLVDASADQMSRPDKGLVITGPVLGRVPPQWAPGSGIGCVTHLHDTAVVVRWGATDDSSWESTLGWRGASEPVRTAALARADQDDPDLARRLRERGEVATACVEEALAALGRQGITAGVFAPEGA